MKGLGTIINVIAVLLGGGIGLLVKSGLKKRFQDILMQACGLSTIFIGIGGALSGILIFDKETGVISTQNTLLTVCSLVIGGLIGEFINIELRLDRFGEKLKSMVKAKNDGSFVDGFVTASLVICVGAMAIVGSIQDGLTGDYSMLAAKALLYHRHGLCILTRYRPPVFRSSARHLSGYHHALRRFDRAVSQ